MLVYIIYSKCKQGKLKKVKHGIIYKDMKHRLSNTSFWFHHLSKDLSQRGKVYIEKDSTLWPESWKEKSYKSYPNSDLVYFLPEVNIPRLESYSWYRIILGRFSGRSFLERNRTLTLQELSSIAKISFGEIKPGKRYHPSGGGRYPLEYYFMISRVEGVEKGLYHYNILNHSIERILKPEFYENDVSKFYIYPWAESCAVGIFITGVFDRMMRKYGERGYRYILLEAGHVGQLVYETCTILGVWVTSLGGVNEVVLDEKLGLNENEESVVYSMVIG